MAQPAADAPRRIDIGARTRTTLSEVKRYTKFVGIMKRVLMIAVVLLLGAVLAYSLVPRRQGKVAMTFQRMGIVNNDLAMIKAKLTGADTKGNPFLVTADEAIQDAHNTKHAKLKNVSADLTTKSGGWVNIAAPRGFLNGDADKHLDLFDAVSMFSDKGYEAHTTLANINLTTGTVVGPRWVRGQGPLGTFVADKFRIEQPKVCGRNESAASRAASQCVPASAGVAASDPKLYLYGNVHMIIYKKGRKKKT